jgi:hypothetical protein
MFEFDYVLMVKGLQNLSLLPQQKHIVLVQVFPPDHLFT